MMVNGKMDFAKVMVHIIIQMVTNSKEIGCKTSNKVWVHIIMLMEIFIRDNGKQERPMAKEIIFIKVERLFIREIGKMVRRKDLASLLFRIIMAIPANGKIIRSKVKDLISTPMVRNMMVIGFVIRNQALVLINIRMRMFISGVGRMIDVLAKAK